MIQIKDDATELCSTSEEFERCCVKLDQVESEATWKELEGSFLTVAQVANSSSDNESRVNLINSQMKRIKPSILRCFQSERTRLLKAALSAVTALSALFKFSFDVGSTDPIVPAVCRMCTRANKVVVRYAIDCLTSIMKNSQPVHFCNVFAKATTHPNKTFRAVNLQCIHELLIFASSERLAPHVDAIESCVRDGTVDAAPEARDWARKSVGLLKQRFPERHELFLSTLSEPARKSLRVNSTSKQSRMPLKQHINNAKQLSKAPVADSSQHVPRSTVRRTMLPGALRELVIKPGSEAQSQDKPPVPSILTQTRATMVSHTGMSMRSSVFGLAADGMNSKARRSSHHFESLRSMSANSPTLPTVSGLRQRNLSASAPQTSSPLALDALRARASSAGELSKRSRRVSMAVIPMSAPVAKQLVKISGDYTNTDWAVRVGAYDELAQLVSESSSSALSAKAGKIHQIICSGLSDSHYRVVQSAVECLRGLCKPLSALLADKEDKALLQYVEDFILKLLIILSGQPTKTREQLLQSSSATMASVISAVNNAQWLLTSALPNLLCSAVVLKQWRVKNSLLRLFYNEFENLREATGNTPEWLEKRLKSLLVRFLAIYSESELDSFSRESVVKCIQALYALKPEQVHSMIASEQTDALSSLELSESQYSFLLQQCPGSSKLDKKDSAVLIPEESAAVSNEIPCSTPLRKFGNPLLPFSTSKSHYQEFGSPSIDTLLQNLQTSSYKNN